MRAARAALVLWSLAGCGEVLDSTGCHKDGDCAAGLACHAGACVTRMTGGQRWAVELLPQRDSTWAASEVPGVAFGAEAVTLKVDPKVIVVGAVLREGPTMDSMGPVTARVLASVPSMLGMRTRQFEAQATSRQIGGALEFNLAVPESVMGREAKVLVVPTPPLDRVLPPWTSVIPSVMPIVSIGALQSKETYSVVGTLRNAINDLERTYVARALVDDRVVSNVVRTDQSAQERFQVAIPRASVARLDTVSIELAPIDPTSPRARMVVRKLVESGTSGMVQLPELKLPDSQLPQVFRIPVTAAGKGLPFVKLRFLTTLAGAVGGDAFYAREAQTGPDGAALVPLIPGPLGKEREYAVAVIPPADSEWASGCVPRFTVTAGSGTDVRVTAAIELVRKLELGGQVFDADGKPIGGMTVTATRDIAAASNCAVELASPPARASTGKDGVYRLLLDPGRYRIDYEPPMGSASPRFFEEGVPVAASMRKMTTLPAGALAEGIVQTAKGEKVSGCEVRVYSGAADGRLDLRGLARTGNDGRFRLILPRAAL